MRTSPWALLLLLSAAAPTHSGWMVGPPRRALPQPIHYWHSSLAQSTEYLQDVDRARTYQALKLAHRVHEHQKRRDGTPFVTHPIAVANLVAGWGMDSSCVVAALLHDAVEDTPLTFYEVEEKFGEEVRTLVQGVTRVSKLPDDKLAELEAMGMGELCREGGDLLQLLDACAGDWRVAVLKVADRLHNMRTLSAMKPHKRARKAKETARVFVPLAHYIGAHSVGAELAALSARHHADDQPQHRMWAARLTRAARYLGLEERSMPLAYSTGSPSITSRHRLRNLILQLDDTDRDRARRLVMRLRPMHDRLARHQAVHMSETSAGRAAADAAAAELLHPLLLRDDDHFD